MTEKKWTNLAKDFCLNHYILSIESAYANSACPNSTHFSTCAFDSADEALLTIDSNGVIYYIELADAPVYKRLGYVGSSTCSAFNPKDKNELFIGLNSTDIKVIRTNNIDNFCLLSGHTAAIINISFFKDYCLTASNKEVIIWDTESYCKVYQLLLNLKSIVIKKAIFSNLGHVAILYESNSIQLWMFRQFDKDNKIDPPQHGLKNVKDFNFTKDGRAMIVSGLQYKVLVYNTTSYELLKCVEFNCQNFTGGRQLLPISLPLDGGANSVIGILTVDNRLKFLNLTESNFINSCCESKAGIKKFVISDNGSYLAFISKGLVEIIFLNKALNIHYTPPPSKKQQCKKSSSKVESHLENVHHAIKEELQLQRLLPILKEYGEYPEKHRRLIWSTIMELPCNKKAYIDLSNKIPHEAMFDKLKNDLSSDKPRNTSLSIALSCLFYWCPILQECSFLPELIKPFVNVFQSTPILGFEASMFIIINYCQKWFEYHPLPPLNVLGIIENILLQADPILFNYFCNKGITSSDYAWPLLQTTLKEVLGMKDWLILWDNLLSIRKPWFLLFCTVAYNLLYRKTIITKFHKLEDFQQFYRMQGYVSVKSLLKVAHRLDCETRYHIHPRRYLRKDMNTIAKGPYTPFLQFEFPKYLTDELRGMNLKDLKGKERHLRGLQLNTLEILEKKRLQLEKSHFMKNIEEIRLNEVHKCYENQVQDDERISQYVKKQTENLDPCKYLFDKKCDAHCSGLSGQEYNPSIDCKRNRSKSKHKNCKSLQAQVDRLEFEVQNLLTTLYNKSSRIK